MQAQEFENKAIRGYEHCHRLIQTLAHPQAYDENKAVEQLTKSANSAAEVSQAFLLTKGLLLEQLQLEANIERPGVYSNPFRIQVSTSKKIQQSRVLLARGLDRHAIRLLEECVSKAHKYELFELELEALELLQLIEASAKGTRTFNRFESYIEEAEQNRALTRATRHALIKYRIQEQRRNQEDRTALLTETLALLEKKLGRKTVGYPVYIQTTLKTELALLKGDYRQAEKLAQQLVDLIVNSAAVHSQEREIHAHLFSAQARTHLRKFKPAIQSLDEAEKKVKKNSVEGYFIRQYRTYIMFYSKEMEALHSWLPATIKSKYTERRPYARVQFRYFQAVFDFLQKDYAAASKALSNSLKGTDNLSTDGRFGHALMLAMAAIENAKEQKPASNEMLKIAMDEMSVLDKEQDLDKRNKTILRILRRLEGQEWDFKKTALLAKGSLSRLSQGPKELVWKPLTHEIIPFDHWFDSRVRNKAYKYKLPPASKVKAGQ